MAEDEKNRIEAQRAALGEKGLAEKAKQLEAAMEFNERSPPPGTLGSVPVPSCKRLKTHNIFTWSSDGAPCPYMNLKDIPLYARVHSLKTNFVYINLILDTSSVDQKTRKWLPLHMNGLAECAVRRGDTIVPHEDVISTTEQLTVKFSNDIGFGRSGTFSVGVFGNFVHIETRCEPKDYEAVVNHLYEVLYAPEITKERLLVFTQRMIHEVAQVRRDGHKMVYDTVRDALYCADSNVHWSGVLRQSKFLKELNELLNAGGDSAEAALREARTTLHNITENLWIHLATDLERYKLSTEPWKRFARENQITPPSPKLYWDAELMSGWGGGFVLGVGGLESSFLVQLSPGPQGYKVEEIAPLQVALNYFTQLEGPMWRLIRGSGLSYGYGVRAAPVEGRLVLSLYKATNCVAAYTKAKSIIDEYFTEGKFDEDLFESARSTVLFEVVENEKCPADVVDQSLMHYMKQVDEHYSRKLVEAIACVSASAAHAAASKWLPTLFEPARGKLAIVCHPGKVAEMQAAFDK
ncbi:hypothetical protein O0L34_g3994 [Tuta absoluta]|nr:hypothetical protein O0L34_g3994 [Tuta absoluta]